MTIYINHEAVSAAQSIIRYIRDIAVVTVVTSFTAFALAALIEIGRAL
jgi:hypothetical protein